MTNIISAQFSRIFKSKLFYVSALFVIVLAFFIIIIPQLLTFNSTIEVINYHSEHPDAFDYSPSIYAEDGLIYDFNIYLFFIPLLVTLFFGKDFSYHTINNNIVAGFSRKKVYLANYIVCFSVELLLHILFIAIIIIHSLILILRYKHAGYSVAMFESDFSTIMKLQLTEIGSIALHAAFFMFILMATASRTKSAIVSFVMLSLIFLMSLYVSDQLYQLNRIPNSYYASKYSGETPDSPEEDPLEGYDTYDEYMLSQRGAKLSGVTKVFCCTLDDILAPRQSEYLLQMNASELAGKYIMYNYSLTLIITVLGVIIFDRKELK